MNQSSLGVGRQIRNCDDSNFAVLVKKQRMHDSSGGIETSGHIDLLFQGGGQADVAEAFPVNCLEPEIGGCSQAILQVDFMSAHFKTGTGTPTVAKVEGIFFIDGGQSRF